MVNYAKRTQFPLNEEQAIVRNEPNFAPAQVPDGVNCAKRSQTWGDWGMWVRPAVVLRGSAWKWNVRNEPNLPRSGIPAEWRLCETNPIRGAGPATMHPQDARR